MQTALILPELVSGRGTIRQGRMVEGQTRQRLGRDPTNHCIDVLQDIHCRNTKRRDARRTQPLIPLSVAGRTIATRVSFPVNLDCQAGIRAEEVEYVRSRRMLPPELETVRALAKHLPENDFRQGHRATKLACASGSRSPRFWCDVPKHTPPPCSARSLEPSSGRISPAAASTPPRLHLAAPCCGHRVRGEGPGRRSRCLRPRYSP